MQITKIDLTTSEIIGVDLTVAVSKLFKDTFTIDYLIDGKNTNIYSQFGVILNSQQLNELAVAIHNLQLEIKANG